MSPTVFLDTPIEDRDRLKCDEVRVLGDVLWAIDSNSPTQWMLPLGNVTGVSGADIEQNVDEIEYPGGRITELVTHVE